MTTMPVPAPGFDLPTTVPATMPDILPTARDGLDTGSIAELVADCAGVFLDVHQPRPWPLFDHLVVVPDDASALIDGLGAYGS